LNGPVSSPSGSAFAPLVERLAGARKQLVSDEAGRPVGLVDELPKAAFGAVARRAHRDERRFGVVLEERLEARAEAVGLDVSHVVAVAPEPVAEPPHRGEDERQLVVVVRLPPGEVVGLDHQHGRPLRRAGERPALSGELRPEDPRDLVVGQRVRRRVADDRSLHTGPLARSHIASGHPDGVAASGRTATYRTPRRIGG